jgi:hypothetical protein
MNFIYKIHNKARDVEILFNFCHVDNQFYNEFTQYVTVSLFVKNICYYDFCYKSDCDIENIKFTNVEFYDGRVNKNSKKQYYNHELFKKALMQVIAIRNDRIEGCPFNQLDDNKYIHEFCNKFLDIAKNKKLNLN